MTVYRINPVERVSMLPRRRSISGIGFLLVLLTGSAGAADWRQVAYDDAGVSNKQSHLTSAEGNWRFDNPGAHDEALRTCAFGPDVGFAYSGLNPAGAYKAKLRFFSGDGVRQVRIKAGNAVLAALVQLDAGQAVVRELDLPAAAFADGRLTLLIEHVSGPNAVVSDVAILSTDPRKLGVWIPLVPRLSPRPAAVAGVSETMVDLAGTWRFNGTSDIQVPGEWVMQGFSVQPGQPANYERTFAVPKDWAGMRIRLRCDAVFSDATAWINGKEAGKHLGGFTPFEFDVTELVKPGVSNVIRMAVISESPADLLASASTYACHPLGGITRGIRLFPLPQVSLSELRVATTFDKEFRHATLDLDIGVDGRSDGAMALLKLTTPDGKPVKLSPDRVPPGHVAIPVLEPLKWDNEHPNLYRLTVQLEVGGKVLETVTQRIGFRQVEVRGNRMFVNNRPVKLRGSNHHEVYPITGRSVPAGIHRRDIELFREGNVNLLRTCHYPPDEALMEAADELGMFIECEAPFCWVRGVASRRQVDRELISGQTAEMVLTFRNHPSVLFWSLANESEWGAPFMASSKLVRQLDPTRPQVFNDDGVKGDPRYTDIFNIHYPGHGGPDAARKGNAQPIYHGEDAHLNAYNRQELSTDPALRDLWGRYLRELWDDIYATTGHLGMSIWSGVDDTFYLKDDQTVGYGTWGPIDGWRREKPEYWNMKKAYSPVRLGEVAITGNTFVVSVENRQNFAELREMKIAWKLGEQSGNASADVPPHRVGAVSIKLKGPPKPGNKLDLTFTDPRGFIADQFSIPVKGLAMKPVVKPASVKADWQIDKKAGQLESVNRLAITGPQLMLLPLNATGETQMTGKTKTWDPFTASCSGWVCKKVIVEGQTTTVEGKYDGAEGSYRFIVHDDGVLEIAYSFTVTQPLSPRQIGLVFSLPRECEVFSWERRGYWDVYPEDHIARLRGTVKASEGFEATSVGPRTRPSHPWRLDNLPYGNNDFCSTKHNVIRATLADAAGRGIAIDGRGEQHVRCWRTATAVNFLVADYSNGSGEPYLRNLSQKDDRPLKPGDKISGTVRLEMK